MKRYWWITLGGLILLGIALGIGTAVLKIRCVPWDDPWARPEVIEQAASTAAATGRPRILVDQADYAFGDLDVETDGRHDFTLTNRGDGPAVLTLGPASCSCVLSDFGKPTLQPGESTKVTLTWKSKGHAGEYQQNAAILTNDPDQPRIALSVRGTFSTTLQVKPAELTLGQISSSTPGHAEFRLLCYTADTFAVLGYESTEAATAPFFTVAFTPLTASQFEGDAQVRSGFLAQITVKPDLPPGAFRQTIRVKTSLPRRATVDVPIEGVVVSDITFAGRGWLPEKKVLVLGSVGSQEGAQRDLLLLVRGPFRKEVTFQLVQVGPAPLQATVGKATPIGDGAVWQTPLHVTIPQGSAPVGYLDLDGKRQGHIRLQTTHPRIPTIDIPVAFAVEG